MNILPRQARTVAEPHRCDQRTRAFDALVLDASTGAGRSAVRSLGRAGLSVATAESYAVARDRPGPARRSRLSLHHEILPDVAADPTAFANALVDFVTRRPTPVVLPASDHTIAALRPAREMFARLGTRVALPSEAAMDAADDQDRMRAVATELGLGPPRAAVLAQERLSNRREGITLMVTDGQVKAMFAHVEHRTSPALGGASVLRESIAVPADLGTITLQLVEALGLDGVCGVEFRRDAAGRPLLMEVNARLAGPVEIAARCGVDFPVMVWRWANGMDVPIVADYRKGVRMRWLRGDLRWLRDNSRRVGRPDSVSLPRSLWMFGSEFLRTARYDCLDLGDLSPVVAETRTTVAAVLGSSRNGSKRPPRLFNCRK